MLSLPLIGEFFPTQPRISTQILLLWVSVKETAEQVRAELGEHGVHEIQEIGA